MKYHIYLLSSTGKVLNKWVSTRKPTVIGHGTAITFNSNSQEFMLSANYLVEEIPRNLPVEFSSYDGSVTNTRSND